MKTGSRNGFVVQSWVWGLYLKSETAKVSSIRDTGIELCRTSKQTFQLQCAREVKWRHSQQYQQTAWTILSAYINSRLVDPPAAQLKGNVWGTVPLVTDRLREKWEDDGQLAPLLTLYVAAPHGIHYAFIMHICLCLCDTVSGCKCLLRAGVEEDLVVSSWLSDMFPILTWGGSHKPSENTLLYCEQIQEHTLSKPCTHEHTCTNIHTHTHAHVPTHP